MNKIWKLTKIQLTGALGLQKLLVDKNGAYRSPLLIAGYLFLVLMLALLSFFYSVILATGLKPIGMLDLLPSLMMAVTCIIVLITTIYKVNGILFGFKDYDMVMSLPVKTSQVIASRILILYSLNFSFALLIMVPAGIVYAIFAAPSAYYYLAFVLTLFATPLIPIVIATLIGSLITAVASRFKWKNALNLIFSFLAVAGAMFFSFFVGYAQEDLSQIGVSLMKVVDRFYPISLMYRSAVCEENFGSLVLFLLISLAAFALLSWMISLCFQRVNAAVTATQAKGNYRMTRQKHSSQFTALFCKELKRFFASPLYVTNTGIGLVLMTILSVAFLFFQTENLHLLMSVPIIYDYVVNLVPIVFCFFIMMTYISACSISLEGKNLWILKSSPVDPKKILLSKAVLHMVIVVPFILINAALWGFSLQAPPLPGVMMVVLPVVFAAFTSVSGLLINLRFPKLDWANEAAAIKQSAASFASVLLSFAVVGILVLLFILFPAVPLERMVIGITLVTALITVLLYRKLMTWGVDRFYALSSQ